MPFNRIRYEYGGFNTLYFFTGTLLFTSRCWQDVETETMKNSNALHVEDRWNWLLGQQSCVEKQCHIPSTKRKWRKLAGGPQGRCSHTLTAISEECLLLVGGGRTVEGEDFEHFDDIWMMDALTARWKQLEPTLTSPRNTDENTESYWGMTFGPPRRGHMAAAYQSKYLIVFGGITDNHVLLNDAWALHVPTLEWKKVANGPEMLAPPCRRGGIACCYQDYFYIMGGHVTEALIVWKLGPLSSDIWTWSVQPTLNETSALHKRAPNWPTVSLGTRPLLPLSFASSALIGSKLWIFGGLERRDVNVVIPSNSLHRLDLDTWEWSVLYVDKNAPRNRFFHGMASIGRFLVIMGGACMERAQDEVVDATQSNGSLLSGPHREHTFFDLFFFDTEALSWKDIRLDSCTEEWPAVRNSFALTRLGDRHLVLFGGGIYQEKYYDDTFALEFELPPASPSLSRYSGEQDDLGKDLGNLYNSGILSDVTLVVGDRRFPVHKAILASRCDFFETMFAGPYSEATTDEVCFDALPEALDYVLRFLYTNAIDIDSVLEDVDLASSVLILADFWNVPKLLEIMETAMSEGLQKNGADPFALIAFAKTHNCRRLAMRCLEFFKQRWTTLKTKNVDPHLAAEIEDYVHSLL